MLEQAEGGTLFLDELGGLTGEAQAKLIHFQQDHLIMRVGGRKSIPVDTRIIAASNTPLGHLVDRSLFRQDLYFRLEVLTVELPPLRERTEDIPALCRHFIALFNMQHKKGVRDMTSAAYARLYAHSFPGNIRELRNIIERAMIFCEEEMVPAELLTFREQPAPQAAIGALPQVAQTTTPQPANETPPRHPLKRLDEVRLRELFVKHEGIAAQVAAELKVSKMSLYVKLKKLGLTPDALRKGV